jgi:hypothetical protein
MVLVISTAKCCLNLIKIVLLTIHTLYKKDIYYSVALILLTQYTIYIYFQFPMYCSMFRTSPEKRRSREVCCYSMQ